MNKKLPDIFQRYQGREQIMRGYAGLLRNISEFVLVTLLIQNR